MRLAIVATAFALACGVLPPDAAVAADPGTSGSNSPAESALDAGIGFRKDMGFTTELETVQAIEKSIDADRTYGVALTKAEAQEVGRRLDVQSQLGPIRAFIRALPSFGGSFVDQRAGGVVVVQLTERDASLEGKIAALAPSGTAVRFEVVSRSMTSLKRTQQSLDAAVLGGDLHGQVSTWGIDPIENRVYVDLRPDATVTADEVRRNFGDGIRVGTSEPAIAAACTDWNNCAVDPWRGGLHINMVALDVHCSTGFVVKAPNGGSDRKILTAGHCGVTGTTWLHDGVAVGALDWRCYVDNCTADTALVNIRNDWAGNLINVDTGANLTITSQQAANADDVNDLACQAGYRIKNFWSTTFCGTINDADNAYCDNNGVCFLHMRSANFRACGGDSGGPVYYSHQAMGTVAARYGTVLVTNPANQCSAKIKYSHIANVKLETGGWLVQTAP